MDYEFNMINITHRFFLSLLFLLAVAGCSVQPKVGSELLSLNAARYGHAAVNDGKNIYVLAGANQTGLLSDIEIIDPKTNFHEILKGRLLPRRYFSAVWDGKNSIYIIGGMSLKNKRLVFEKRVEVFNTLTHEVSFAKSLPAPTRINSAVLLDGRIFVFGGTFPEQRRLKASAIVSVFDIAKNSWMRAENMPTAKTTKAVVKDGYIYVVGGYDRTSNLNVFERFDPKLNKWQTLPSLPVKMSAHSAVVVDNQLFTFGDYDNLDATYVYDFNSSEWKKIDIGYKASRHNAVTLLNNNVYVIGGNTGSKGPFLDYIQSSTF